MKPEILVRYAAPSEYPELGRIMARSFRGAFADFISAQTLDACAVAENCAGLLASLPEQIRTVTGRVDGTLMGLLVRAGGPLPVETEIRKSPPGGGDSVCRKRSVGAGQ